MAKTIYFAAATLDGYIADTDDGIDWLTGYEPGFEVPTDDAAKSIDQFLEGIGSIVMGSSTYEFLLDYGGWMYADRPTWVLTSRDLPVAEGANLRFHDGSVTAIHEDVLAAAGDRDVWVMGGGPVASDYVDAGLLDELHVTVVPIVLGTGKALFDRPVREPMRLLGTNAFGNGMFELRYALAH